MNNISLPASRRAVALTATAFGLILGSLSAIAAEAELTNYIDFSVGASDIDGDRAYFQKRTNSYRRGSVGVEDFRYSSDLGNDTSMVVDGKALIGNRDFLFNFKMTKEGAWYLDAGFKTFRTWYDGSGGYIPRSNTFVELYDDEMYIDRTNLWAEFGLTPEEGVGFTFRYDYTEREGTKDSTHWADVTTSAGSRAIVPTFLDIQEKRHILNAKAFSNSEAVSWEFAGRYETGDQTTSKNIHRAPGSTSDRFITHHEGSETDLFMLRGNVDSKIGETLSMSTGMAHYELDANLEGSRIYGSSGYDPAFSTNYTRRQYHDEGFYNFSGEGDMTQTMASINLLYTPTPTFSIVPSLLAEKTSWGAHDDFIETNVGSPAAGLPMEETEIQGSSDRNLRSLTELIEARYTGLKNVVINASVEATQSYGTLDEDFYEPELGHSLIYRTSDYRRDAQKYAATLHYYARPGLNFTAQAYWQGKQNSFSHIKDSTPPVGGDRYPGFITHQDFETNDFNVRMSWTPMLNVRSVTRYDYQETTIRTQKQALAFIETGDVTTHVLSQSLTWNPLTYLYVQANGNMVYDQLKTPVRQTTGLAGPSVLNSDNNYVYGDLTVGMALDERTDLTMSYSIYDANNYQDNSFYSVPYGAGETYQTFGVSWFRRVSSNMNYVVKYQYGDSENEMFGGQNDFRAHSIYAKVQYRF